MITLPQKALRRAMLLAGLISAQAASALSLGGRAPVTLFGGGASLPAAAYVGTSFYKPSDAGHSARLTPSPDPGSLFASLGNAVLPASRANVSYCQTGTVIGVSILTGTASASGSCPDFSKVPSGFGAPAAQADFVASDLPLSRGDHATLINLRGSSRTQAVQFPVLAAAIGIAYNNADVRTQLMLDDATLCGLFSGAINDWSQLGSFPSKPIRIVYRSDASGATFALSNHLSAVCSSASFKTASGFTNVISPLPPRSLAANGNVSATGAINATDGSLGYVDLADTRLRASTQPFARIGGFDPLADLVPPAVDVVDDMAIGANDSSGRPMLVAVPPPANGRAGCVALVTPDSTSKPAGYPIMAVTYLLGYYSGNENFRALRDLFASAFDARMQRSVTTIGSQTGFAYLAYDPTRSINRCLNR